MTTHQPSELDVLRTLVVELVLVNGPDRPFNILYSHEELVQTQVVPDSVLPRSKVLSEKCKCPHEPLIYFIQRQLLLR